jgi:hypothetical protein
MAKEREALIYVRFRFTRGTRSAGAARDVETVIRRMLETRGFVVEEVDAEAPLDKIASVSYKKWNEYLNGE